MLRGFAGSFAFGKGAETGIFELKITRKKGIKNRPKIFILKGKCRKSDQNTNIKF
jgi:hypothetical protein